MTKQFTSLLICSAVYAASGFTAATADVTVHRITQFSGLAGMGASEMTSTEHIQGLKKREESTHRFTGSVLSRLTNESQDASIYRLDKDVIWQLDPQAKRYSEQPIENISEMMAKSQGQQNQTTGKSAPDTAGTDESQTEPEMKITRNEVTVNKTGKSDTKNGFPCEEYVAEWIIEAEDVNTGAKVTSTMTTVLWTTPEKGNLKQLRTEEAAYNQAFAKKINVQLSPEEQQQYGLPAVQALLGSMDTEEFSDKMSKIEGYPIVVDVTWRSKGEDPNQQAETADTAGDSSSSAPDMADLGELAKGVGSLFGGLMGKPKPQAEPAAASASADQGEILFQSRTEITKVEVTSLDETMFEVPTNYTKQ